MDVVDQIRWIPEFGLGARDGLAAQYARLDDQQEALLGAGAADLDLRAECGHYEVIGDGGRVEARGPFPAGRHSPGIPPTAHFVDAVQIACPECGGEMSAHRRRGQSLAGCRHRALQHAAATAPTRIIGGNGTRRDWISESFPGQFRNWFYSLLAMATVVDQSPPFLQNFGYATLMAEDGRPMHKSWGNAIEFNEAADQIGRGRDALAVLRPETGKRPAFWLRRGDVVRRQFLLPLWNVYSFFVTYANLDGWKPRIRVRSRMPPKAPPRTAITCWTAGCWPA